MPFPAARAPTPDIEDDDSIQSQHGIDSPTRDSSQPLETGRTKASAAVGSIDPAHVLARVTGHLPMASEDFVMNVEAHYVVPDGEQSEAIQSDEFRAGMKRNAAAISRSQYEIYSFSTKYNLPETAINELLEMISNVSGFSHVHAASR